MIEFIDVNKSYEGQMALRNFNIKIEDGELITVIGSSGGGKTTFLKLINGLLKPTNGKILLDGQDISQIDQTQLRRQIGYVIQSIALFPHMTIKNNISYVMKLNKMTKDEINKKTQELVQMVGLDESLLNKYPNQLSGGQKQRIGIARALGASPKILLMDEPFGAVDEITRKDLQDELLKLHKLTNTTIVFVTHDIREALKLGSKVLVINDGDLNQFGTADELKENPATDFVKRLIEY